MSYYNSRPGSPLIPIREGRKDRSHRSRHLRHSDKVCHTLDEICQGETKSVAAGRHVAKARGLCRKSRIPLSYTYYECARVLVSGGIPRANAHVDKVHKWTGAHWNFRTKCILGLWFEAFGLLDSWTFAFSKYRTMNDDMLLQDGMEYEMRREYPVPLQPSRSVATRDFSCLGPSSFQTMFNDSAGSMMMHRICQNNYP